MGRRSTLLGALIAVAILAAPAAGLGDDTARALSIPSVVGVARPLRQIEHLVVNNANQMRTMAQAKCEAQGVKEIRALLETSDREEMWVYLAGETEAGGCQWIEIGGENQSVAYKATVRVDHGYLAEIMTFHPDLIIYHFHPRAYFAPRGDRSRNGFRSAGDPAMAPLTGVSVDVLRFSMPSPEDIYFMMESGWLFERHSPAGGSLKHRVVTPLGVVDYASTEAGRLKYAEDRGSRWEGVYLKLLAATALTDESLLEVIGRHPDDLDPAFRALAARMSNAYLRIEVIDY